MEITQMAPDRAVQTTATSRSLAMPMVIQRSSPNRARHEDHDRIGRDNRTDPKPGGQPCVGLGV